MMGLPDCKEVVERLSREQDEPPTARRRLSTRIHLLICNQCRRYRIQLAWLRRTLARIAHGDRARHLPETARQRIRARLREEARNSAGL